MDSQTQREPIIRDQLPWVTLTLDHTEKLAELIPEDELDWRPVDPSGKWSFSLVEIIKHVTDARIMYVGQLTGEEDSGNYWSEPPGEDGSWKFGNHKDKAEVVSRLAEARKGVEEWLDKPASMLLEVTGGTTAAYNSIIEQIRKQGGPLEDYQRRGPANVNRVLMALAVHEAGHRGTLHALLRQKGINIQESN
jgi:uncharacterized damage-inducible protein DinB